MRRGVGAATVVASLLVAGAAAAQEPSGAASPGDAPDPASVPNPSDLVPAGAPVEIELAEAVSSKRVKRGDTFAIRLASPLMLGGREIVPAGVTGVGQVVDVAPAGMLGRPAKLLLAARYLEFNGGQIKLKAFTLGGSGVDTGNVNIVGVFVPAALPVTMLVRGGEIELPVGARAQAKLADDLPARPSAPAVVSPLPQPDPGPP